MQNRKTLKFWDDFYETEEPTSSSNTEWIVQPSESLLATISEHIISAVPQNCKTIHILEIGAGNSLYSLRLWQHLMEKSNSFIVHVLATDVSEVCIRQNFKRDEERINVLSDAIRLGTFRYDVLDALQNPPSEEHVKKYDFVLDKGCLDTFLFRGRNKKVNEDNVLVRTLLDNIHEWLKSYGKYILLSPRKRLSGVQDFCGFAGLQRKQLNLAQCSNCYDAGSLVGEKNFGANLFIFSKNCNYSRELKQAFRIPANIPLDDERCQTCGVSFKEFRRGSNLVGKNGTNWSRKWRGHLQHCKP